MDARREELEKKRAKLAELRRAREERKASLAGAGTPSAAAVAAAAPLSASSSVSSLSGGLAAAVRAPRTSVSVGTGASFTTGARSGVSAVPVDAAAAPSPPSAASTIAAARNDIDSLVSALLGQGSSGADTGAGAASVSRKSSSVSLSSTSAALPLVATPSPGNQTSAGVHGGYGSRTSVLDENAPPADNNSSTKPKLGAVDFVLFDCPPKEKVFYSKQVQTEVQTDAPDLDEASDGFQTGRTSPQDGDHIKSAELLSRSIRGVDDVRDQRHGTQNAEQQQPDAPDIADEQEQQQKEPEPPKELKPNERLLIESSDTFLSFLGHATKYVERVLSQNAEYDALRDYAGGAVGGMARVLGGGHTSANGQNAANSSVIYFSGNGGRESPKVIASFADDRLTYGRCVTSIDWHPKFPELIAASYSRPNATALVENNGNGLVAIWNRHLKGRPEYILRAQSEILTAKFSPYQPSIIVGGSYSGQVVLWDTRVHTTSAASLGLQPVLKSTLSSPKSHTHPIYSLAHVGTANAHSLVTVSTDGMVCVWALDMLAQPLQVLELALPHLGSSHMSHPRLTDEIAPTCLAFPTNETGSFFIGTEEGIILQGTRFDRSGIKAGINPYESYCGHTGYVTSLDFHPGARSAATLASADFQSLLLTTSVDWSIKLWDAKTSTVRAGGVANVSRPLASFDHSITTSSLSSAIQPAATSRQIGTDNAIYAAKWHPKFPSVFASSDGNGNVCVWDMAYHAVETPVAVLEASRGRAATCLAWNPVATASESSVLAAGTSDGRVVVWDMKDALEPVRLGIDDATNGVDGSRGGEASTIDAGAALALQEEAKHFAKALAEMGRGRQVG